MNQIRYLLLACLMILAGAVVLRLTITLSTGVLIRIPPSASGPETVSQKQVTAKSPGQLLFEENCRNCHAFDRDLSGPALRGVAGRGPWAENKEDLISWIKDPAAFIPTTTYTLALKKTYGLVMPSFSHLKEDEIISIVSYITDPSAPG